MLKSKYCFFISLLIFLLSGCSNKDVYHYNYIFRGEGLYWKGAIKFDGIETFSEENGTYKHEGNSDQEMVIEYKDKPNAPKPPKVVSYFYDAVLCGGSGTTTINENIIKHKSGGSGGHGMFEDEVIVVVVKYDDKVDIFELHNEESKDYESRLKALDNKLDSIVSSLDTTSLANPYDYLKDNEDYKAILRQGKVSFEYFMYQLENSHEDGLREYLMAVICSKLLGNTESDESLSSGLEWYKNNREIYYSLGSEEWQRIDMSIVN
jgi:hypothetical protein